MTTGSQDIKAEARTHACIYPEKASPMLHIYRIIKNKSKQTTNAKSLEFKFKPYEGVG